MGFQDRDYMRSQHDHGHHDSIEDVLNDFLKRHPRFFTYVGVAVGILVLVAISMINFMPRNQ